MKKNWVDFKEIKAGVSFNQVLDHYGIELKPAKGNELLGLCPFHEDTKPSFRVNTEKGVFHCFGCDAKGNVLDFVSRKESVTIRKAAVMLSEWFGIGNNGKAPPESNLSPTEHANKANSASTEPAETNQPLGFTLKLTFDHPYLKEGGIEPELAEEFGIGFCKRGMMKNRIAIPIHDANGNLVAYAGRWVSGDLPEGEKKYKLPPGFKKSIVLYNLHRIKGKETVFIVEGFFSVIRLHKIGIYAIGLMGRSLSQEQEKLLQDNGVKSLMLMLDGDPPGREAQAALLQQLGEKFDVGAVDLPDGTQPDTVEESVLYEALS